MSTFPDFARGEDTPVVHMTQMLRPETPAETPTPTKVVRTSVESRLREPVAAAVKLHREPEPTRPGPIKETATACRQACKGMVYDLKHWNDIPGTTKERLHVVATRGGRLPYLVLTVAIAFLVFFVIMYIVRWISSSGSRSKIYSPPPMGPTAPTLVIPNDVPLAATAAGAPRFAAPPPPLVRPAPSAPPLSLSMRA